MAVRFILTSDLWKKLPWHKKVWETIKDFKDGFLILCSKKFWKDFLEYYSADNIAKRLDRFAERIRK